MKTKEVNKMTIEKITAQLDRISADSWYDVDDNHIDLTIIDFVGFADDWSEIYRELTDRKAIEEVSKWFKENADYIDGDYYRYYHFGEIVVAVGYTSFDI